MALAQETSMASSAVDAFLSEMETGVLSFAREDRPYSIPVSFGYNSTERAFYLRLVSKPESTKRAFLTSSPKATLVVYDGADDRTTYRSIIASGTLDRIEPNDMSVEQIEQYGDTRRPLFEIWADDRDELDIQLYRMAPDELTGRRTDVDW